MECDLQPLNLLQEVKSPGTPSLDGALLDSLVIFPSKSDFLNQMLHLKSGRAEMSKCSEDELKGETSSPPSFLKVLLGGSGSFWVLRQRHREEVSTHSTLGGLTWAHLQVRDGSRDAP